MSKLLIAGLAIALLFVSASSAYALSIFQVPQGGTGWGNIQANSIPYGNGTGALSTTTQGTAGQVLSWSNGIPTWVATSSGSGTPGGSTSQLQYNGSGSVFAGVSTTTLTASSPLSLSQPISVIGNSASALSINTSGTWSGNAGTATALASNGSNCSAGFFPLGVDASGNSENCTYAFATTTPWSTGLLAVSTAGQGYTIASSSLFGYTPLNPTRTINTTWPITGGGDLSADRTIAYAGFGTTSNTGIGANLVLYTNNSGIIAGVSTSTIGTFLGSQSAGVLGTSVTGLLSMQATSSLYGTGTGGKVLGWNNNTGGLAFIATSSVAAGTASTTLLGDTNTFSGATTTMTQALQVATGGSFYIGPNYKTSFTSAPDYVDTTNVSTVDPFTEKRLLSNLAVVANGAEATYSMVTDCSGQGLYNNQNYFDHTMELYPTSFQAILGVGASGTCAPVPLVIRDVIAGGNKDRGNHVVILPNGTTGIINAATSSVPTSAELYVASSTATQVLEVDSTPGSKSALGTSLLTVLSGGNVGIASSSPSYLFSVGTAGAAFYINSSGEVVSNDSSTGFTGQLSPLRYVAFKLATTTTWTASTSQPYDADIIAPFTGTIKTIACGTDAGTLTIEGTDGSTHVYLTGASTTANTNTFSLSITKGDVINFIAGTPASSPTWATCTIGAVQTP